MSVHLGIASLWYWEGKTYKCRDCHKEFKSKSPAKSCPACRNGEPGRQRHRDASARQWARIKARRARG